ncbi:MAG: hypothetical protein AAF871_01830 [Pseudomonadota bacterium]
MKKVIAVSALLCVAGTASFACSAEESHSLSLAISEVTQAVVAADDANLGRVMSLMQEAAVSEYHSEPSPVHCSRQVQILGELTAFADDMGADQSALLK